MGVIAGVLCDSGPAGRWVRNAYFYYDLWSQFLDVSRNEMNR